MARPSQTIAERASSRLIATFVIIILVTTVAASTVAYWLTRNELEQQAWERLEDGQRVTLALLTADRLRLDSLLTLTAQRPTLQQLLRDGDGAQLDGYIEQFQAETDLDLLAVYAASGELLASTSGATPWGLAESQAAAFCLLPEPSPQLALAGRQPILDAASGELLGYVALAIFIDDAYEEQLAAQTGMEQSVLVDGQRIASTLSQGGPAAASLPPPGNQPAATGQTNTLTLGGESYLSSLLPLTQADGQRVALAEVALPITPLKEAQRRILLTLVGSTLFIAAAASVSAVALRKNINDEAVQHLRSHFLGNITHEFRTPLSALRASVEFLVDEMSSLSREEINELLRAIHISVTGLQTLVDNLLESISIEAGHFAIRPEPIELDEVLDEAGRIMRPLLQRRQQQLAVSLPATLPAVYGDPVRLTQVLVNLLANASKYGPMGQTIDLSVELTDHDLVRVVVSDRGPGLSPAMRENLFRRFGRFSVADGAQYGIGLGLWVVKVIVTEHDGAVGVDERPGGGASFWFTLPTVAGGRRK